MIPPGSIIGILGGGQLGRMTALAAAALGYRCHIFCPEPDSPAKRVTPFATTADYNDRAAVNLGAPHHAVGRHQLGEMALIVIARPSGDRADFVKAALIDEPVEALAYRELAGIVLALDLVGAAERLCLPLPLAQLVQFRLPAHPYLRFPKRCHSIGQSS